MAGTTRVFGGGLEWCHSKTNKVPHFKRISPSKKNYKIQLCLISVCPRLGLYFPYVQYTKPQGVSLIAKASVQLEFCCYSYLCNKSFRWISLELTLYHNMPLKCCIFKEIIREFYELTLNEVRKNIEFQIR